MDKRKQMKNEYKQSLRPMGVLQVKSLINGKVLVVGCSNLDGKINSIKFQLEMGSHMNKGLQQDWNDYGEENFSFEVIEQIEPDDGLLRDYKDDISVLEELWLERLQPYGDRGYHKIKP